jgi:serine/threonine protein phosphatase PrpC
MPFGSFGIGEDGISEHAGCEVSVGAHTVQGTKGEQNQDTYLVMPLGKTRMLIGVFDGHGAHGHIAAARARDIFASAAPGLLPEELAEVSEQQAEDTLRILFQRTHVALAQERNCHGQLMHAYSGTTATAVIIDMQSCTMACAHVGDSALVLTKTGDILLQTKDHVVDAAAEQRVLARGGEVREAVNSGITARRIFARGSMYPGIMMDRSLGDLVGHELGMMSCPDVKTGVRLEPGSMVILASDGVWDPTEAKMAIHRAAQSSDAQTSAKSLVEQSRLDYGSNPWIDDITAVVVMIGPNSDNSGSGLALMQETVDADAPTM